MAPTVPPPTLSEPELVEMFRSTGENRFFEGLYLLAGRKVFHVCLRFLHDYDSASDLTHEAFLRAYERFSLLQDCNFSAWACRIAANLCLNRIRDQKTRNDLLDLAFPRPTRASDSAGPSRGATEEIGAAREILDSLPLDQRRALLLKYVEGYSYREIAEMTGCDNGQVRSLLQSARRHFQLRWQSQFVSRKDKQHGREEV